MRRFASPDKLLQITIPERSRERGCRSPVMKAPVPEKAAGLPDNE